MTSFDGARLELLGSAGAYDLITASRTALEAPVGWATAETLTYTHPAPTSVCGMMLESLGASTPVARGRSATTAWRFACGDAAARNEALVAGAAGGGGGRRRPRGVEPGWLPLGPRRARGRGAVPRGAARARCGGDRRAAREGAGAAGDRPQLVQHQPRRQPQRAPRPSAGALLGRLLRGRAPRRGRRARLPARRVGGLLRRGARRGDLQLRRRRARRRRARRLPRRPQARGLPDDRGAAAARLDLLQRRSDVTLIADATVAALTQLTMKDR